ncbi:hypothetical protein [Parasutterella sp.]|uniref:hypothetical protein n=1 Tax=Parasutterella sp. TaxID=2049037 RepID=UPI0035208ECD
MATGQEILHLKLMSYKNKGKTYLCSFVGLVLVDQVMKLKEPLYKRWVICHN